MKKTPARDAAGRFLKKSAVSTKTPVRDARGRFLKKDETVKTKVAPKTVKLPTPVNDINKAMIEMHHNGQYATIKRESAESARQNADYQKQEISHLKYLKANDPVRYVNNLSFLLAEYVDLGWTDAAKIASADLIGSIV